MKKKIHFVVFSIIVFFAFIILSYTMSNSTGGGGSGGSQVIQVVNENLIKNGDFSIGTSDWNLWMNSGGEASMVVEKGELKVTITNQGPNPWNIGLGQMGFTIENGVTYTLSFNARTDTVQSIMSLIQLGKDPWISYSGNHTFNLTTTMTQYSYTFTMTKPTDSASDLEFFLGGKGDGNIYFDNIVLIKAKANIPEVNFPIVKPSVDRSNIIIYEVVPGSYNGGSWDGGQCIKGITNRLDQIKVLGVNCIWLTPVFEGEGMGYWTYDYYNISVKLGTLNDMKELVYEAHKRDIMVILDLVINYTWTEHPFFQDVLKNKGNSPYKDYYMWSGEPGNSDYNYYFDWTYVPNLNLSNPEVRDYLFGVAEYWVKKLDIDGYRVDCAWALEDRYPGFSLIMKNRLAAIKPDIFLLGEGNVNEARFFNNGYDSAYDWDLRGWKNTDSNAIPSLFEGSMTPQKVHSILTRNLPQNGLPFRFTENHDHLRAASLWGENGSKVAHTIVLTSRGYPDVFGGAEVGFAPDKNVQWSQDWPVIWNFNSPLYSYFKKIIAIRKQYLKSNLNQYWVNNDSNVVYSSLSVSGSNKLITVANCSTQDTTVTLNLVNPQLGAINVVTELISGTNVPYGGGGTLALTLDGYGTAILLVR